MHATVRDRAYGKEGFTRISSWEGSPNGDNCLPVRLCQLIYYVRAMFGVHPVRREKRQSYSKLEALTAQDNLMSMLSALLA